jgi:hypothetical protein
MSPALARTLLAIAIIVASALILISGADAATYTVSPTGNDAGAGSMQYPWRTVSKCAATLKAGDACQVRGGTYNEAVIIRTHGTAAAPITFKAYPGELPIIDGQNTRPGRWGALFESWGDYVVFDGFEVRNSLGFGVETIGRYDVVRNCSVHHSFDMGVFVRGDYALAEKNRVWESARMMMSPAGAATWSTGMSAARDQANGITDGAVMRSNVVYHNWGEGLSTFEATGTVIEDNTVYDNWAVNLYISDAQNVLAQRNLVYATAYSDQFAKGAVNVPMIYPCNNASAQAAHKCRGRPTGLALSMETTKLPLKDIAVINNLIMGVPLAMWTQDGAGLPVVNILIAHNTLVNAPGTLSFAAAPYSNVRFTNNIIVQDNAAIVPAGPLPAGISVANNLYNRGPTVGAGDIAADPKLARMGSLAAEQLSADWFKPLPGSPAIGNGLAVKEVAQDWFKALRPARPTIGAIEGAVVVTPPPVVTYPSYSINVMQKGVQVQQIPVTGDEIRIAPR